MKSNLPTGWVTLPLEDINEREAQGIDPGKQPNKIFQLYSVPSFDSLIPETILGSDIKSGKQRVEPSDVLICKINPRINRVWIVGAKGEHEQIGSTEWIIIKPIKNVLPEYLLYFCRSNTFRSLLNSEISGVGGSLTRARPKLVFKYEVPIAPLAEQRRIVAQLDAVMQKLEASQERLEKLPELLKKFRQAVLAAAVSGKLTEAWRAEQPRGETGADLLDRIRAERRAQWEEKQLAKMKGKQLSLNKKYKEPAAPDTSELPELPEGWTWVTVQQLGAIGQQAVMTGPFGTSLGKDDFTKEGVPVLTIGCLTEQGIDLSKAAYVSHEKANEIDRYQLAEGDLLFSRMASVGRAGFVTPEYEGALFNYHIMRLRLSNYVIMPYYFLYYVRGASEVTNYLLRVNHGATRDGINTEQLLNMPVALPPFGEQQEIVRQVNHYFELADQLEARFEQAAALVEQLPQALLAKAFSGQLVPQDPTDEPASALLERLRAEPAAPAKGTRGRKPRPISEAPLFG
jgi:type I restriction enzyme S subunit